jgi:hypothetical protein
LAAFRRLSSSTCSPCRGGTLCVLAAAVLALYLWPALRAPALVNSDSVIDLAWARDGAGILTPAFAPNHPAKPGYLLFLRAIGAESPRRVVVVQSLLLWASITATALLVARRFGSGSGIGVYVALVVFLRLRDSASSVMSEALGAALLLPFAAVLLEPPKRRSVILLLGVWASGLFLVRPNLGAAAAALAAVAYALERRWRAILPLAGGFALLTLPVLAATATPEDPTRGLRFARRVASADYGWVPGLGTAGGSAEDARRALVWRAFHGVLGTEFYDARWSHLYRRWTTASRILAPFAVFASAAILLVAPWRGRARIAKALGITTLAVVVVQSYALGALPRYALPFLPIVFVFSILAVAELARASVARRIAAAAVFFAFVAAGRLERETLDWEWGEIESSGARIDLEIPRGSLPERGPATLHVRVAPSTSPSRARIAVLAPSGGLLYDGRADPRPRRSFVTIPLSEAILAQNRGSATTLTLVAKGDYDAYHFMLFRSFPHRGDRRRGGKVALRSLRERASLEAAWIGGPTPGRPRAAPS